MPRNNETFGNLVKQRRQELGLSQNKLAEKVPCAVDTIRAIEQNKKNYFPSPGMQENILKALSIDSNMGDFPTFGSDDGNNKSVTPAPRPKINNSNEKPQSKQKAKWSFVLSIMFFICLVLGAAVYLRFLSYTGNVSLYKAHPEDDYVKIIGSDGRVISNGGGIKLGEQVAFKFIVQNSDNRLIIIPWMVMGARGPGVFELGDNGWDAPEIGFNYQFYTVLNVGNIAVYQDTRAFFQEGDYFVEPIYADIRGWHGIRPYARVYFRVER